MYVQCKIKARLCNHSCSGRAISITYSKCVFVAPVILNARRMRRIILSSIVCPAVINFRYNLVNGAIFRKTVIEHKMCVLIFSTNFLWKISHSKNNSAVHHKYILRLHVRYPLFLSVFNKSSISSKDFSKKNPRISNFMKILPCGRKTDITKFFKVFQTRLK